MTNTLRNGEGFMDMWSSFETLCFNGSLTKDKIHNFTLNCSECQRDFTHIFEHFHQRYQNEDKLKLFLDNEKNDWFQEVLKKNINEVSSVEKTKFMVYVVERYKSYIFDQNNSDSMKQAYKTELDYCVDTMTHIFKHQEANRMKVEDAKENNKMSSVHLVSYATLKK